MGQQLILKEMRSLEILNKEMFQFEKIIGDGSCGKVWKARYLKFDFPVAIKQESKRKIIKKHRLKKVFENRDLHMSLFSTDIVNLYGTFQDTSYIYLVLDYMELGDLRKVMNNTIYENNLISYTEDQIQFISGSIINGLDYLRTKNIIHRDIKPENIVFDERGFIRIADFDISVKRDENGVKDMYGTPEYMSPERFYNKKMVSFESDYYALGIIMYELVMGKRPIRSYDIKEKNNVFTHKIEITPDIIKKQQFNTNNFTEEFCDLVNKLLIFEPDKRIGHKSITEIKQHPFFADFSFKSAFFHTLRPPLIPPKINNIADNTKNDTDENSDSEKNEEQFFYGTFINMKKINLLEDMKSINKNFENYNMIHKLKNEDFYNPNFYNKNYNEGIHSPIKLNTKKRLKLKSLLEPAHFVINNNKSERKHFVNFLNLKSIKPKKIFKLKPSNLLLTKNNNIDSNRNETKRIYKSKDRISLPYIETENNSKILDPNKLTESIYIRTQANKKTGHSTSIFEKKLLYTSKGKKSIFSLN